jgi:hypothetical protein
MRINAGTMPEQVPEQVLVQRLIFDGRSYQKKWPVMGHFYEF